MLIQKDDNGTIIKLNVSSGFLNIKQAFVFSTPNEQGGYDNDVVGKICFEFGKYNSPNDKKLKETIKYFMSIEDAALLAELLKTGKIVTRCIKAKEKNPYGAGFVDMSGVTTSKQMKIQQGDTDAKFFIKALEGPGEKTDKGLMAPKYNDQTTDKKVIIAVTVDQLMKIGLAMERAIRIFDNLLSQGLDAVIEYSKKMRYHGDNQPATRRNQKPQQQTEPFFCSSMTQNTSNLRPEDIF